MGGVVGLLAESCSGTWVSVDYDEQTFRRTLLQDGFQAAFSAQVAPANAVPIAVTRQAASSFSQTEKEFMNIAKKMGEILKLEMREASGERVEATQRTKMNKKNEYVADLRRVDQYLDPLSDARSKYKDVLGIVLSDVSSTKSEDSPGLPLQGSIARGSAEVRAVASGQLGEIATRSYPRCLLGTGSGRRSKAGTSCGRAA